MNAYFNGLQQDLQRAYPDQEIFPVEELGDLRSQLQLTRDTPSRRALATPDRPRTSLGAHLLVVSRLALSGSSVSSEHYQCCDDAETNLLRSIDFRPKRNQPGHAPLILTYKGQEVAVRKQVGEASTFGLRTLPELGLIANSFLASHGLPNPRLLGDTRFAFRYELSPRNSFRFLRSSIFDVPVAARRILYEPSMSNPQVDLLEGSVTYIRRRARVLLADAHPLN